MEVTKRIGYDIVKSVERISEILDATSFNSNDQEGIPSRSLLTYSNGFYVNVTALFIDIVGSSDMTDSSKRTTLAKIYRSFISECTAIMNSSINCEEININGDCVWGVFRTQYQSEIDSVFSVAAQLNSLVSILNYKLRKKNYQQISVGIGIDYGRALMVKAGYSGSGLNDVIWMGDVVNKASNLCHLAGRDGREPILVSSIIQSNLCEEYKKLLTPTSVQRENCYSANVVNTNMEKWYEENCR